MPRTPLASALARHSPAFDRRTLLRGAAVAATGTALAGLAPRPAQAAAARVAVVGAGLAGLSAAYDLRAAGVRAEVFEAADRVGGRCWTDADWLGTGLQVERGGELIDQGHTAVRQLARRLGLDLVDLLAAEAPGTGPGYWFDGRAYTERQARDDLKPVWQMLHKDVVAAGYPTTYRSSTARGRQLDATPLAAYLDAVVPGGLASPLGQLLDVAYTIEYGADTAQQSALNLLYLLAYRGQGSLRLFGASNEKYRVVGGNQQLADRMAAALAGQVRTGSPLSGLARSSTGTWTLAFDGGRTRVFDHVVLALPFSVLRDVDTSRAGFPLVKRRAVDELGMAASTKLHVGFGSRFWQQRGSNGETYTDTGSQCTWDVTRGQRGTRGVLVHYTGGSVARATERRTAAQQRDAFLRQVEPVLPGARAAATGQVTADVWSADPWTRGSYSFFRPGQYARFSGAEAEPVGTCRFAGEHTSRDFQGYLNGAVETGQRAAREVLDALG